MLLFMIHNDEASFAFSFNNNNDNDDVVSTMKIKIEHKTLPSLYIISSDSMMLMMMKKKKVRFNLFSSSLFGFSLDYILILPFLLLNVHLQQQEHQQHEKTRRKEGNKRATQVENRLSFFSLRPSSRN
jgi:hypothetical protein